MKIPKDLIKELVREENFTSTNYISETIKGMFINVLEEVLGCELDEKFGYDKHERRSDNDPANYRNGSTKRKLKTQIGEIEINVPRDKNGEYEPQIIGKY